MTKELFRALDAALTKVVDVSGGLTVFSIVNVIIAVYSMYVLLAHSPAAAVKSRFD